jgi:hypothetical protein
MAPRQRVARWEDVADELSRQRVENEDGRRLSAPEVEVNRPAVV